MSTFEPGPEARYLAALSEGRFELQRCTACAHLVFQPRTVCPHCGGQEFDWVKPNGNGIVYATTTVRVKKSGPYDISLIELEEGVRMMARVEGMPPEEVRIGMSVVANVQVSDGAGIVVFHQRSEA